MQKQNVNFNYLAYICTQFLWVSVDVRSRNLAKI